MVSSDEVVGEEESEIRVVIPRGLVDEGPKYSRR